MGVYCLGLAPGLLAASPCSYSNIECNRLSGSGPEFKETNKWNSRPAIT